MVPTKFRSPCRRPVAVLVRLSPGRWRREERNLRWPTTQPHQVRTARSVLHGGRPVLHDAKAHRSRATGLKAVLKTSRSPCHRPTVVLVRSTPVRRCGEKRALCWPTTQPCELRTALPVLRGLSTETPWSGKRADCTSRNSRAAATTFQSRCRRPVGVLVQSSISQRLGEERSSRWPTTQPTPNTHCAARPSWTVGRYSPHGGECAGRAPREPNAVTTKFRSPCRRPVAVLVRLSPSRWRGEERVSRWASTQPHQVRTARSVLRGGRPVLHDAKARRSRATGLKAVLKTF